jgi:hypothetical protein
MDTYGRTEYGVGHTDARSKGNVPELTEGLAPELLPDDKRNKSHHPYSRYTIIDSINLTQDHDALGVVLTPD